ncbi:4'-phosphopantetheinyl transferase superfamily protein [Arcicella aurantiaca]|uniref:4'-phosphopantetheinyl transferase superfamily protein n=1 Tax=Arcicella aurantiaca TaxID=591202 RepID=A0A316DIC6_9BACT|nr:4'-phosphopantetheinyl transferase superfamily protein [Arcicella aurantiaca]PWK17625.1 4'-phosphopantetheinyl transferase superfamily protein [Arcicella aurantiaca]
MIWIKFLHFSAIDDIILGHFLEILPPKIQKHILQKKRPDDQKRSLLGIFLVKNFLAEHCLPFSLLFEIQFENFVKPAFQTIQLDFNISHTNEYVVAAFSFQHKIGIDIEQVRTVKGWDDCTYLNDNDLKKLQIAISPSSTFLEIWCQKEAVLKACGCGFAVPISEVEIMNDFAMLNGQKWYLHVFHLKDNLSVIASNKPNAIIQIEEYKIP